MSTARKLRILVAKPGLDGHDRGAKVVARALADAGYEVVYTGLHQTPEMIAAAAVQEAVDAVGLSIMSGAHMTLFPAVIDALKARGAGDVIVFGGGIVPKDDLAKLTELGVAKIFTPGTATTEIVALAVPAEAGLAAGSYRLFACAALTDIAGNPLAGGTSPAGDFAFEFRVARTPRIVNPNFDAGLDGWNLGGPVPAEQGFIARIMGLFKR